MPAACFRQNVNEILPETFLWQGSRPSAPVPTERCFCLGESWQCLPLLPFVLICQKKVTLHFYYSGEGLSPSLWPLSVQNHFVCGLSPHRLTVWGNSTKPRHRNVRLKANVSGLLVGSITPFSSPVSNFHSRLFDIWHVDLYSRSGASFVKWHLIVPLEFRKIKGCLL